MGDNRISIYAGRPLQAVLDGHDNRSARVNAIAERYLYILNKDRLAFTKPEWLALCHALRDYCDGRVDLRIAWVEIEENGHQLSEQWGIDGPALAQRLREATAGQQVATLEVVQRVWQHADLSPEVALLPSGARITP